MQLTRGQRPHSYHEPNYHCPEANLSPHHSPMYHAHKCGTSRQPYAQRDPTPSIDIELRRSIATKSCQTMVEQSCRQQRRQQLAEEAQKQGVICQDGRFPGNAA